MLISNELATGLNEQVGHEYGACLQYVSIAAYFDRQNLKLLAKLFYEQANEEKAHAEKFVRFILDTQAPLQIPAVPAPAGTFGSSEDAVGAALKWEHEVTGQITRLMETAIARKDFVAYTFLQGFIDEQLEEITKMDQLLSVVQRSGERNLLMVEAYLAHLSK